MKRIFSRRHRIGSRGGLGPDTRWPRRNAFNLLPARARTPARPSSPTTRPPGPTRRPFRQTPCRPAATAHTPGNPNRCPTPRRPPAMASAQPLASDAPGRRSAQSQPRRNPTLTPLIHSARLQNTAGASGPAGHHSGHALSFQMRDEGTQTQTNNGPTMRVPRRRHSRAAANYPPIRPVRCPTR